MMVHPSYVSYHLSLPPSPQILGVDLLRHSCSCRSPTPEPGCGCILLYAAASCSNVAAAGFDLGDFLSETGVFLYFLLTILLGITYLRDTQS